MNEPPPFVDIHCHLLPELDDGAADFSETLAMAEMAASDGIATIVATPHQLGNYADNHGETIRQVATRVEQALARQGIPLSVLPGADVRIEPDLVTKIRSGEVVTLADRRRHVLLELPHEMYLPLDRLLLLLRAAGIVGILSHPERNQGILGQPHLVESLVEAGCLMQVTAGSLVGSFGPHVERFAGSLVRQGLVHFVATDAHGTRSRRPLLRRAFDCVADLADFDTAVALCCRNPAAVVAGQHVVPQLRRPARGGWFRWKKAG